MIMEQKVSQHYRCYLEREHERLERALERERSRPQPDQLALARLKKLKLAVRDQLDGIAGRDQQAA